MPVFSAVPFLHTMNFVIQRIMLYAVILKFSVGKPYIMAIKVDLQLRISLPVSFLTSFIKLVQLASIWRSKVIFKKAFYLVKSPYEKLTT